MGKTVAVEGELSNVARALRDAGYEVIGLDDPRWKAADAVVIKGMDRDFLNVQDTGTRSPVIDASGMKEMEVVRVVADRLRLHGPD
ncbi:MAG: YkuS family protein [Firmicutes bacterium]|nr:YkuS family protein [Bacillota bacterium]